MENRNMTILKWSVGILAILNIVLLLNIWKKPGNMPPPPHHREGGPSNRIIEELKFSPDQKDLFVNLRDKHRDAMRDLYDKGKELRSQYFDLLKQETPDAKIAEDLASAIAQNQKSIEGFTFEHFKEVRKLCDANQKKIFDSIIGDILRNMAGPPRGHFPPRPDGETPPHPQH